MTRYLTIAAAALLLVAGGLLVALQPFAADQDRSEIRSSSATTAAGTTGAMHSAAAGSPRIKPVGPVSSTVARSFATFRGSTAKARAAVPVDPLLADSAKRQAMESTEAPTIDYARAVPVSVSGSSVKAWIAPAGKKVCAIVALPDGAGTGGGCNTPEEVRQGDGLTIVPFKTAEGHQVVVLQVVVDGQEPGKVKAAGKTQAIGTVSANGNAVAGTFPAAGTVSTGSQSIALDAIREP